MTPKEQQTKMVSNIEESLVTVRDFIAKDKPTRKSNLLIAKFKDTDTLFVFGNWEPLEGGELVRGWRSLEILPYNLIGATLFTEECGAVNVYNLNRKNVDARLMSKQEFWQMNIAKCERLIDLITSETTVTE